MLAKDRIEALKAKPEVLALVKHFIEVHTPYKKTNGDVVLPRRMFDCLVLLALVGLDVVDPEDE